MSLKFLKDEKQKKIIFIIALLAITFFTLSPSLKNDFTNWDDDVYVVQNELIKNLTFENLEKYFTEPVSSNFHPLTMFSLALDYNFFELNAFYYHLHNLLLHLLNVCLAFFFIYFLSNRNLWASFFVALIFGIHPMHVESVAWISERKDLLYTFYFLAGLIIYVKNFHVKKWSYYIIILLVFILSLLSKSAAVVFPVVLLLIDYYKIGKLQLKDLLNKIPFLILSVIVGIIAFKTQEGALSDLEQITISERFRLASFGFFAYIFKFFVPVNLNNLALFPDPVPDYYFAFFIAAIVIVVLCISKSIKNPQSEWLFGFFFFIITIALVLQVISVGKAVIAERYTYVPYIGVAFSLYFIINKIFKQLNKNQFIKKVGYIGFAIIILVFSVTAHNRTKVWKDGRTLWNDAIKKDKENYNAYLNLGYYYYNNEQYQLAINQFNNTLQLKPENKSALFRRHRCYVELNELEKAFADIVTLRSLYVDEFSYYAGIVLLKQGKFSEALNEFRLTEKSGDNKTAKLDLNIGICLLNTRQENESLKYLTSSIEKDSTSYEAFFSRGVAYYQTGNYEKAKSDLNNSIKLEPGYKMAYWYRALVKTNEENFQGAYDDFSEVLKIDGSLAEVYYYRSIASRSMGNNDLAIQDALKAKELGYRVSDIYLSGLGN